MRRCLQANIYVLEVRQSHSHVSQTSGFDKYFSHESGSKDVRHEWYKLAYYHSQEAKMIPVKGRLGKAGNAETGQGWRGSMKRKRNAVASVFSCLTHVQQALWTHRLVAVGSCWRHWFKATPEPSGWMSSPLIHNFLLMLNSEEVWGWWITAAFNTWALESCQSDDYDRSLHQHCGGFTAHGSHPLRGVATASSPPSWVFWSVRPILWSPAQELKQKEKNYCYCSKRDF